VASAIAVNAASVRIFIVNLPEFGGFWRLADRPPSANNYSSNRFMLHCIMHRNCVRAAARAAPAAGRLRR
jgi:hypothetical protein